MSIMEYSGKYAKVGNDFYIDEPAFNILNEKIGFSNENEANYLSKGAIRVPGGVVTKFSLVRLLDPPLAPKLLNSGLQNKVYRIGFADSRVDQKQLEPVLEQWFGKVGISKTTIHESEESILENKSVKIRKSRLQQIIKEEVERFAETSVGEEQELASACEHLKDAYEIMQKYKPTVASTFLQQLQVMINDIGGKLNPSGEEGIVDASKQFPNVNAKVHPYGSPQPKTNAWAGTATEYNKK